MNPGSVGHRQTRGDNSHDVRSAIGRGSEKKSKAYNKAPEYCSTGMPECSSDIGGFPLCHILAYAALESHSHVPNYCTLSGNNEFHSISEYATITHTKYLIVNQTCVKRHKSTRLGLVVAREGRGICPIRSSLFSRYCLG